MPRTAKPTTSTHPIPVVNIGWIHPFLEILEEVGAPYDQLLARANLPKLNVDDGSLRVPTAKIYAFVALARQETRMPDLGLRAGSRFEIEPLLPDAEWSWTRSGVFRSIESFIDVALESSSNVDMWIESQSDPAKTTEFLYLGTFGPDHPAFSTIEQFMVALMVRWTRYGAGPKWNPARVNLRSASVPQEEIRRLAGDAVVKCGQAVTSIAFPSRQFSGLMERFPEKGSAVWTRHRKRLARWNEAEDLAGSLRVVLPAYLPDGSPNIEQAARLIGTSVRTLQRRLKEQGISYSQLLEDLRHDLAIYLLRDRSRRVAEIGRELGYRDAAIFTRSFRRWTGLTPSQYRQT